MPEKTVPSSTAPSIVVPSTVVPSSTAPSDVAPSVMRELCLDLLAVLWPTECVGCKLPDRDFCFECKQKLFDESACIRVEAGSGMKRSWFAAAIYADAVKELIVGLKHGGRVGFAVHLGRILSDPLLKIFEKCRNRPWLVVMPSRPSKLRQRGYQHVALISRNALKSLDLPRTMVKTNVLKARRGRTGQIGLDYEQRLENAARIKVARRYRKILAGQKIILVDDVITTGATLEAATNSLNKYGAKVVGAASVSVALKRAQR